MYWSLKDKKALVIDDFQEVRAMLKSVLKFLECDSVKQAKDGKEALALMRLNQFDFILCDYNLGDDKDGQQILEEAKFLDILPYHTVFMMITAENTSKMVMGALDWMPDDYVQKPITKAILSTRLKRLLERKQSLKEISKAMMGEKRDYEKALDLCEKKIREEGAPVYELIKLKADLLLKLERYDAAAEYCQEFFNSREVSVIGLLLAKALFQGNRVKEAEKVIDRVISNSEKYVIAYDYLAKIKASQGDFSEAQRLLEMAVSYSPKSVTRQRALAEIAFRNESFSVAEKAYKQAISQGRYSCFRSYMDYISRAQSLVKNNQSAEALGVINELKKDFRRDVSVLFHASVLESRLYEELEKKDQSKSAVDIAYGLFKKDPEQVSSEVAIDLAKICMNLDKKDQANELMDQAAKNSPDDQSIQNEINEARASVAWLKKQTY